MMITQVLENYFRWSMRLVIVLLAIGLILKQLNGVDLLLKIGIGLLLLIPVGRVCITLKYSLKERDKGLILISTLVLFGLAASLAIGLYFHPLE